MSLSTALGIGISGLQYSQAGLSTISHNVVNANTPGYSRQVAQAGAVAYNGYGAGVNLTTIQRITDQFLTTRTLNAASDLAYATARQSYLQAVEGTFSGASDDGSLATLTNAFFGALSNLANSPSDAALRRNAVQSATLLTDTIKSVHDDLTTTQTRLDQSITAQLATVNTALKRIYDLNVEIAQQSGGVNGANTNDLQDARDAQVAILAQNFKLNVSVTGNGSLRVLTEDGRKLVDEGSYVQLTRGGPAVNGFAGIVAQNVKVNGELDSAQIPIYTDNLSSGSIKSLVQMRDSDIPSFIAQLDQFTKTFTTAFNKVSSQGSTVPPQGSLTSANTLGLGTINSDLYTGLDSTLSGASFNASVVDSNGNVIATTVGNGGPIVLGGASLSLAQLAALINGNADVGNTTLGGTGGITATAATDSLGRPIIKLETQTPGQYVVLSNVSGDVMGALGFNNFFTGTDSNTVAVNAALEANPDLIPVGRMRADGGLSSLNNENILAMSQLAETKQTFGAAGGLAAQYLSPVGYLGQVTSNLATVLNDANSRQTFADNVNNQITQLKGSVSGVNINEELAQMLVFQNSFQASSRIITVVNDLFDTLLSVLR